MSTTSHPGLSKAEAATVEALRAINELKLTNPQTPALLAALDNLHKAAESTLKVLRDWEAKKA